MSGLVEGDRVTVTLEGTFEGGTGARSLVSRGGMRWYFEEEWITRLPNRLPSTPGSVIDRGDDGLAFLGAAGSSRCWRDEFGDVVRPGPGARIVFDAGAV